MFVANKGERVLKAIQHRGPDGAGSEEFSVGGVPIWLGHTRLAIQDLSSAGHQPMRSADGRWWLTFNGEIYNHLDLRKELQVSWRGHSDTETLVEGISTWGIERVLPRLNGMFAFAAVDTVSGRLYLVRDPFGIKPLYYRVSEETLGFASEIGSLLELSNNDLVIDPHELQTFLTLRYVPGPATLYKGVQRLQPGHVLTYEEGGKVSVRCFVTPTKDQFTGTLDDAVVAYRDELQAAVRRQLLSDVPVGILMSGGIDSALIGAIAADCGHVLPAYTVGFGGGHAECEIEDAAETAKVLGMPHSYVTVGADDLWDAMELCIKRVEEPLGTTSILPMWYLAKFARQNVKVVLTGQGSDEPWGGYFRYQSELLRKYIPYTQLVARLAPILRLLPKVPEFVRRAIYSMPLDDKVARYEAEYALFTKNEKFDLTGSADSGSAHDAINYWVRWVEQAGQFSPAENMMRIDTRMNLADDLLLYGDKISMAYALEARVPMLDIELVRFIESLPLAFRVTLNHTKIVHKLLAGRFLPTSIVNRKKRAFQVPFTRWTRGVWRDRVADVLLGGGVHLDFIRRSELEKLWRQHVLGTHDFGRQIFSVLTLAMSLESALRNRQSFWRKYPI